jgi:hypothetical protein
VSKQFMYLECVHRARKPLHHQIMCVCFWPSAATAEETSGGVAATCSNIAKQKRDTD